MNHLDLLLSLISIIQTLFMPTHVMHVSFNYHTPVNVFIFRLSHFLRR